ncbi:MAG: hypothetical protein JNL75_09650 [Chitinophagales bacterium]|nr:hypothetical protein [Chitinophagales bacterium]
MNQILEKLKGYLPYIAGLILISCIIFYPELQGKKLSAHDAVTWQEASKEWKDYQDKGESIFWTNRIFSGMPLFTVASDISGNLISKYFSKLVFALPNNVGFLFFLLLCGFVSLILLNVNKKIAFICAIALGLNTWILDSLWASHPTKILSFAFLLPVYAGFICYMRDNKLIGLIAIMLGINLSIAFGHYQIVYYGVIVSVILALYFLIDSIRSKTVTGYLKKGFITLIFVAIGALPNLSTLLIVEDYNKETMRGGKTELVKPEANSTSKDGGLDINYAFSWSYSWEELVNFFVPDATGGSSNYTVKGKKSKLAEQQAQASGQEEVTLPFYWGIQPFTGAPNYLGAITLFLFIFSLFYWKNNFKYALIFIFVLSLFMGLGRSFLGFNELLFQYLPLYNKFRTPTMSFSILNTISVITIGLGLTSFFRNEKNEVMIKALKYSAYTFLGLLIIGFAMISSAGYTGVNDLQTFGENKQALDLMIEDRASFFKSDLLRTLFLVSLVVAGFYFYIRNKFTYQHLIIALGLLIFFDLWSVHKRYLSADVFQKVDKPEDLIPNEAYNQYLEQDKSHFRIFNTTSQSVFSSNTDGYRFSNVGGYSPAKLYRYQDLIDVHLSRGNMPVLNMLNTKYLIVGTQDGQKMPQQNPDACGNAWFIKEVKFAKNANEEMDSIGTFNPKNTVWIDQRFKNETNFAINADPSASISLTKYHPDNMEYQSKSSSGGFVVFSEIWYKGNEDWNLYVNGKPQKLVRVNYLLRGAYIPAGNNKVEMKFTAKKLDSYLTLGYVASVLSFLLILGLVYWVYFRRTTSSNEQG